MNYFNIFLVGIAFSVSADAYCQTKKFSDGSRICSSPSGSCFYMIDGLARPTNKEVLQSSVFVPYYPIIAVDDSLMLFSNMNQPIDSLCLLKGKSDTIYLFMDGFKHAIQSPADADAYQLNLNSVKYYTEDALNEIPSGKKLIFILPDDMPSPCGVSDKNQ